VLWALDLAMEQAASLASLRVTFKSPVTIDEHVACETVRDAASVRITLKADARIAATIDATLSTPRAGKTSGASAPQKCRDRKVAEFAGAAGALPLGFDPAALTKLFARLPTLLPSDQIAILLATTRLVGMECPGLRSVYSSLRLTFGPEPATDRIDWRVKNFDDRFALLTMDVSAAGVKGSIGAFHRPEPQAQPAFAAIKPRVDAALFAGQVALVIGGSRGIGELTAKILAAGGAEVIVAYNAGEDDARRVAREIVEGGGRASWQRFDVQAPPALAAKPTHLYYFATPQITSHKGAFSNALFGRYCAYYVGAFINTVQAVRPRAVFYPSSVYVEEMPAGFAEYALAKAAGEAACRYLAAGDGAPRVAIERLPRLPTDQTVSFGQSETADPVPVLLKALRGCG
jgi:hypothetical protein